MVPRPVRLEPVGVTWKEYVDRRMEDQRQANERLGAMMMAVNDERWRVNENDHLKMNEIRQQLNEQARLFALKDALTAAELHFNTSLDALRQSRIEASDRLEQRVRAVENFQANITGRYAVFGFVGFLVTIGVTIALHYLK